MRGTGGVNPDVYKAIVEQSTDAVILSDREGAILIWNRGAERVFGYGVQEALGQSLDLIIPERMRAAHWKGFRRAVESGKTKYGGKVMTTRSVHKDGRTLYVDLSFSLVDDGAGELAGVLATGRDCTERYLVDKALRAKVQDQEKKP